MRIPWCVFVLILGVLEHQSYAGDNLPSVPRGSVPLCRVELEGHAPGGDFNGLRLRIEQLRISVANAADDIRVFIKLRPTLEDSFRAAVREYGQVRNEFEAICRELNRIYDLFEYNTHHPYLTNRNGVRFAYDDPDFRDPHLNKEVDARRSEVGARYRAAKTNPVLISFAADSSYFGTGFTRFSPEKVEAKFQRLQAEANKMTADLVAVEHALKQHPDYQSFYSNRNLPEALELHELYDGPIFDGLTLPDKLRLKRRRALDLASGEARVLAVIPSIDAIRKRMSLAENNRTTGFDRQFEKGFIDGLTLEIFIDIFTRQGNYFKEGWTSRLRDNVGATFPQLQEFTLRYLSLAFGADVTTEQRLKLVKGFYREAEEIRGRAGRDNEFSLFWNGLADELFDWQAMRLPNREAYLVAIGQLPTWVLSYNRLVEFYSTLTERYGTSSFVAPLRIIDATNKRPEVVEAVAAAFYLPAVRTTLGRKEWDVALFSVVVPFYLLREPSSASSEQMGVAIITTLRSHPEIMETPAFTKTLSNFPAFEAWVIKYVLEGQ
jgi:hypothetical protein